MDELYKIGRLLETILESGILWKLILFIVVVVLVRGAYRIQHSKKNSVDFLDLIRDQNLPDRPISPIRMFYVVGATITTAVYALACTRPTATIQDINIFTVTYGGMWILSQAGNKLAERPVPAVLPTPPGSPSVTVTQNNPSPPEP